MKLCERCKSKHTREGRYCSAKCAKRDREYRRRAKIRYYEHHLPKSLMLTEDDIK